MSAPARVVILSVQRDPATVPGSGDVREDRRPSARVEKNVGGVQAHFASLREGLEHRGHDVTTVTSLDGPWAFVLASAALTKALRRINPTWAGWFDRRWHAWSLRRAAQVALARRDDRPTLFYAQCTTSTEVALRLRRSGDRVTSVIHVFDDSEADEMAARGACRPGDRLDRRVREEERRILPRADGLVFVSRMSQDSILAARPELRPRRRRVVPNFLSDEWTGTAVAETRDRATRLVTVGSIDERKNQAYAVEIVDALRRSGREVHLDIVGEGPRRSQLEGLITTLESPEAVTLRGQTADVRPILRTSDVYLHTSTQESFGIALIEAMAVGLPVAAIPVGGVPSVFDDGVEGRYLAGDDADADAGIVGAILDDAGLRATLSEAARRRVERDYSSAAVIPALVSYMMGGDAPAQD